MKGANHFFEGNVDELIETCAELSRHAARRRSRRDLRAAAGAQAASAIAGRAAGCGAASPPIAFRMSLAMMAAEVARAARAGRRESPAPSGSRCDIRKCACSARSMPSARMSRSKARAVPIRLRTSFSDLRLLADPLDQRAVELHRIAGRAREQLQPRIVDAEIVEHDGHAAALQPPELLVDRVESLEQHRFRYLDAQPRAGEPGVRKRVNDGVRDVAVAELRERNVDRQAQMRRPSAAWRAPRE